MSRVKEGRADAGRNLKGPVIRCRPAEAGDDVQAVYHGVEPIALCALATSFMPVTATSILELQVRGIEDDQAGELERRRGRDDFAAKAALGQQRQPAAVIEMGMRQQDEVDCAGIETEIGGILIIELAPTLEQSAIDQDAPAIAFQQMTGTSDRSRGAVE